MKVYLAAYYHWDHTDIIGVYSTDALAEEAIERWEPKEQQQHCDVTMYEVDEDAL